MPSNQRDAPGNGLNDRVQRRPATTGKAASTAKPGLKARPSLSSITNRNEETRGAADETPNPTASGTGSKVSTASSKRSTSPTKASIGRRSNLGSTINVEKRAVADRSSTASPSKTPAKSTSHNARLSTSNSHRSTRPIHYSPQSIGRSGPSNKRLSAISASPTSVHQGTSAPASVQPPNQDMTRKMRPALGARKSTMSVTIEQRLREMSVVSTMLRAAMADDGSGDDEIKEEYGNQVDEDLAMLKEKLNTARRSEGREPLDAENDTDLPTSIEEAEPVVDVNELKTELATSEARVNELKTELATSEARVNELKTEFATSEARTREIEIELTTIRAKLEKAMCLDESIKDDCEGEIFACDRKLDELFARHQKELEAADTRADEAEKLMQEFERDAIAEYQELRKTSAAEASARVTRLLNDQLRGHKAEVDSLTAELASERAHSQEAASKAQNLAYTSVDLKNSIDDLQEKNSQLLEEATCRDARFQEIIDSKYLEIQQMCHSLEDSLKHAAEYKAKLHAAADREQSFDREIHDRMLQVEQIKSAAEERLSQSDKKTTLCIQKINELEAQLAHASDHGQQLSQDHLQEVKQMQGVIEALQYRIQQIHEAKETELENQRLHLTQEHDDCMLKARETHEKDVQSEKENSRKQLDNLKASRDLAISDLHDLHNDYESAIDDFRQRLDETEGMLQESKPALKEAQELLTLTKERCIMAESYLRAAVAGDSEKADIITAKDAELARVYRQRNAERASLVAAKEIVAAMNIELESAAVAHDEAISAEFSTSLSLADRAPLPPSSDSTNPFIDQILDQIKSHNPQASPERINAIAANLLSKYRMGQNGELEAGNEEISSILQFDLKKLGARCRDLTNRFKSMESSEIKNAGASNSDLDLLMEKVRELHAEKVDLQEQLTEAEEVSRYYEEKLQVITHGTVFGHVKFTKEGRDMIREARLQKDDDEDDQPRFEHIEDADPSIMGNVAGMQEQLRAIENTNENLIEDQQRLVQKMSSLYKPEPLPWPDASTSEGEEGHDEAEVEGV